ncbi:MAG: ABC transporter ATP-binding protein [Candidatus Brocadiia bacterium]|nr:ABC transporter ATP-binding protein [Candidatus Brocadiia bacterium]
MDEKRTQIERLLRPGEQLVLLTESDIAPDGTFGRSWLAVSDQRVLTFGDGEVRAPLVEVALADVKEVRSVHRVGRAALEAQLDGRKVELVRYTNTYNETFARIAKSLSDACKGSKAPEFDLKEYEHRTCPHCGLLLPEKGSFCPACLKKREVLTRFWRYVRPHWRLAAVLMIVVPIGTGLGILPPYLIKVLTDQVFMGDGGARLLLIVVGAWALLWLVPSGLAILRGRLAARLAGRVAHEVRLDFYNAVQGLALRRHDKTPTGSLISRLTSDASMLNYILVDMGIFFIPCVLKLVFICAMLFVLNWKLALLVVIPAPLGGLMSMWMFRWLRRLYFRVRQRHAKMTTRAADSITGIRVVKAFAQEPTEMRIFGGSSGEYRDASIAAETLWATAFPVIEAVPMIGHFLVWIVGGLAVLRYQGLAAAPLTFGDLMAFTFYIGMFYGPLGMLLRMTDWINRALTAAQRLFEIMDADQEAFDDPAARPLKNVQGAFKFENVHFAYVPDKPVLKGIDAEIGPGEMIGLVGKSGAGKTTITNLICRFYDVDDGSISLDGVDLREIKLRDLRRHIGIVPQEPLLFNTSVAENIAYGQPDTVRENVVRAAIAANAHGFIMRFPDGYDTRCGERGARLSAGQKQRIAIARAVLHDPKILILDEATSSVDSETEQLIQEALARLVKGRTTFAIAHRLSTLRNSARLMILEEGEVSEFGSHEELMKQEGLYHRLVQIQSELSSVTAVGG